MGASAEQTGKLGYQSGGCVCAGKDGKAMKRVLQWGAPPAAMAFSLPYVLAMLPSSIEASVWTSLFITL